MERKKIYPSSQLVVALDPKVLKCYLWILAWQSQVNIKYYPKQFSKAVKMTVEDVEKCIQSLEDAKLIDISYVDQTWMITPNAEQAQKYYDVPLAKVLEGRGIPMAEKVTWNVLESEKQQEEKVADMNEQQLQAMILRLQAQLAEKQEVSKMVKQMSEPAIEYNDLPF